MLDERRLRGGNLDVTGEPLPLPEPIYAPGRIAPAVRSVGLRPRNVWERALRLRPAYFGLPVNYRNLIVLTLLTLVVYLYFVPTPRDSVADAHFFPAVAAVDRGTLSLDGDSAMPYYQFTVDQAYANGHYYSNKPPGLSLWTIPFYAMFVSITNHPYADTFQQLLALDTTTNPWRWWARDITTIFAVQLPGVGLIIMMYLFLGWLAKSEWHRVLVTVAYAFGTFAWPYVTRLYSHQFVAVLLFGAFMLLFRARRRQKLGPGLFAAGLLAGYAIISETATGLIVACLGVYLLSTFGERIREALKAAALFTAGSVPPLLLMFWYNAVCFGSPFSSGYTNAVQVPGGYDVHALQQGFMGITFPRLEAILPTTVLPYRGLFYYSPFLLLGIAGLVLLIRRKGTYRSEAVLCAAICAVYYLFDISFYFWDGGPWLGPRYLVPMLPFLAVPVIAAIERWPRLTTTLIGVSLMMMFIGASTLRLGEADSNQMMLEPDPFLGGSTPGMVWHFFTGHVNQSWPMIWGLPGLLSVVPLAMAILAAVGLLWYWNKGGGQAPPSPRRRRAYQSPRPEYQPQRDTAVVG